MKWFIQIVL